MPNFNDPKFLTQQRDVMLLNYRRTGSRAALLQANQANWKLQQLKKQAQEDQPKRKRGRPRKETADV